MSNSKQSLTPSDLVVLAAVAGKPRHGYDLWRELEEADVKDWAPVSKPQIYYSLKKMQSLALISEKRDEGPSGGPRKTVFAITRPGRAALRKNLSEAYWAENRDPPPFVTWAALSLILPVREKRAQVNRRRAYLRAELAREERTLRELKQYDADTATLARSLIRLVIEQFKVELAWLDTFEKEIASQ